MFFLFYNRAIFYIKPLQNKNDMSYKDLQSGRVIKFRGMTIGGNWVFGLLAENTQYKIAKRYGLVTENIKPVVFYFETVNKQP